MEWSGNEVTVVWLSKQIWEQVIHAQVFHSLVESSKVHTAQSTVSMRPFRANPNFSGFEARVQHINKTMAQVRFNFHRQVSNFTDKKPESFNKSVMD